MSQALRVRPRPDKGFSRHAAHAQADGQKKGSGAVLIDVLTELAPQKQEQDQQEPRQDQQQLQPSALQQQRQQQRRRQVQQHPGGWPAMNGVSGASQSSELPASQDKPSPAETAAPSMLLPKLALLVSAMLCRRL